VNEGLRIGHQVVHGLEQTFPVLVQLTKVSIQGLGVLDRPITPPRKERPVVVLDALRNPGIFVYRLARPTMESLDLSSGQHQRLDRCFVRLQMFGQGLQDKAHPAIAAKFQESRMWRRFPPSETRNLSWILAS
jgi:hypothetical protein